MINKIPLYIILVLSFMGWGYNLAKHGTAETKTRNAWSDIINLILWLGLLFWMIWPEL